MGKAIAAIFVGAGWFAFFTYAIYASVAEEFHNDCEKSCVAHDGVKESKTTFMGEYSCECRN